ncbi:MAG: RNA methyltransferase [Pirellulaceae bacterium]|nr:RNA methyltransferase [Pirellulaceae bacterium]
MQKHANSLLQISSSESYLHETAPKTTSQNMLVRHLTEIESPLLDPYRELKRTNLTRWSQWFIAEGRKVVERLLVSSIPIYSVLVSEKRWDEFGPQIPDGTTVLVVPHDLCGELVGFDFHAGILACAERPAKKSCRDISFDKSTIETWLICPNTNLPDNLGTIIRMAAAFGVHGLVCGPETCDPYSRRTVRVSMGNIFQLPLFEPRDLEAEIRWLRDKGGFEIVAANQSPIAVSANHFRRQGKTALVLGNEANGIPESILALCQRQIEIKLSPTVDSLNVANAAAILLYELTRSNEL